MRYLALTSFITIIAIFGILAVNVDKKFYVCKDHRGNTTLPLDDLSYTAISKSYKRAYNKELKCKDVFMSILERNEIVDNWRNRKIKH
jgi:hypothetical protein